MLNKNHITITQDYIKINDHNETFRINWNDVDRIHITRLMVFTRGYKAICFYKKGGALVKTMESREDFIITGYRKDVIKEIKKIWDKEIITTDIRSYY